ncbi:hypothetical protein [Egbenema bharatensis]|uniref:hypothetical protein n=1 Tax=Egbenema bharatensis TaxID=3463334 RepID=UPI003A8BE6AE
MSRDQQSIRDTWNAAQEILSFTAGMDYESLIADRPHLLHPIALLANPHDPA